MLSLHEGIDRLSHLHIYPPVGQSAIQISYQLLVTPSLHKLQLGSLIVSAMYKEGKPAIQTKRTWGTYRCHQQNWYIFRWFLDGLGCQLRLLAASWFHAIPSNPSGACWVAVMPISRKLWKNVGHFNCWNSFTNQKLPASKESYQSNQFE